MNLRLTCKTAALGLAMLPLLGATCTEDKLISFIIDGDMIAEFNASGELNTHTDEDTITDIRATLEIDQALTDQDVDASAIDPDKLLVKRVFYRVTRAEAGRTITNADLTVGDGTTDYVMATGFSFSAASVTDWIEITDKLQSSGIDFLNQTLHDLATDIQASPGGTTTPVSVEYAVSGDSVPAAVATDFDWAVKVEVTGIVKEEYTLPDF